MKQLRPKKKKKLVIVARMKALSAKMGDDTRKLSHDHHRCHASPRARGERARFDSDARSRAPGVAGNGAWRLGPRGVRRAGGGDRATRSFRHLPSPSAP